jgi:hypothetical protein
MAATLSAVIAPLVNSGLTLESFPAIYDLDLAVGQQEDTTGLWVGVTRDITTPLTGVYFSLDVAGLGLDQGSLQGPLDPTSGVLVLPDADYRTLLYANVAANSWDGTIPGAYKVWNQVFAGTGTGLLIQDHGDMTMTLALTGVIPSALTIALFEGGYLQLKPAGVGIRNYITPFAPSVPPYFGLDAETSAVSGLDVGGFGVEAAGS